MNKKAKMFFVSMSLLVGACTVQPSVTKQPDVTPIPSISVTPVVQSNSPSPSVSVIVTPTPSVSVTPSSVVSTPTPVPTSIEPKVYTNITTIAGTGQDKDPDLNLNADKITFRDIRALARDSKNNIYAAINDSVIKITDEIVVNVYTLPYRVVTSYVQNLNGPRGLFVDKNDNLYISDTSNHRILKCKPDKTIETIAGTSGNGAFKGDGGLAKNALINQPSGLWIDSADNIYFADKGNHRIRKIDKEGKINTIAGMSLMGENGIEGGDKGDGGYAVEAQIKSPISVTVDYDNNVYFIDENDRIRKIDTKGILTTIIGTGARAYNNDGTPARTINVNLPQVLYVSPYDKLLYFADTYNHCIRRLETSDKVKTIAGTTKDDPNIGDYRAPLDASISTPNAMFIDNKGNIYVYDSGHKRIRLIK